MPKNLIPLIYYRRANVNYLDLYISAAVCVARAWPERLVNLCRMPGPERSPELALQHLARPRLRQWVAAPVDLLGHLVAGDAFTAEGDERGRVHLCPGRGTTIACTASPHFASGTPK